MKDMKEHDRALVVRDGRVLRAIRRVSSTVPSIAYEAQIDNEACLESLLRLQISGWVVGRPGSPVEVYAEYPDLWRATP